MAAVTPHTCAYCGIPSRELTRDHVVPCALWVKGERPGHPVIVPACLKCHKKYDDEATYFRNCLVSMCDMDAHPMLGKLLRGPVVRSIGRRRGVARDFFRNSQLRERRDKAGIITGSGRAFELDLPRFNRIVEKIVRGLFFFKSHERLPDTHEVGIFPDDAFWDMAGFQSLGPGWEPAAGLGDDVFTCRCQRDSSDDYSTAWLLVFYQKVVLFAWSNRIALTSRVPHSIS